MNDISIKTNSLAALLTESRTRPMPTIADIFKGWLVTSRMEFLGDSVVKVMLPLLLILRHEPWDTKYYILSFWSLVIWLLGHWVGSSINCLADYHVDHLDKGRKSRLARSIDNAGGKILLLINGVEAVLASGISIWLAIQYGKPLLPLFWGMGLVIAYLYSFNPVRLKSRNIWNPISLTLIVYVLPFAFGYHLLSPVWDRFDMAVLFVYSIQIGSSFFADEVPDHDEDKAMNVRTPCVVYGRTAASRLAAVFYVVSCMFSLGLYIYDAKTLNIGRVIIFIVALLMYTWVLWKYLTLARISKSIEGSVSKKIREEGIVRLKKVSNTPAEIFVTSIGALLLAAGGAFI